MAKKPTYEELEQRVKELENEAFEHKKAEEALRESEEKFKTLFEFAPDAYYLNDLEGYFIDSNKAAEELLGYRREELIGKNFLELDLLPPEQLPKAVELLKKNIEGQATGPNELIINRKDGSQILVEISTLIIQMRGQSVVLGIARDMTERKQVEETLRENEEKYSSFLNNLVDGAYETDDMGNVTYINEAAAKLVGKPTRDIVGKPFLPFFTKDSQTIAVDVYQRSLNGEDVGQYEVELTIGRVCQLKNALLKDKDGKIVGVFGIMRDISKLKRAEEELRESEKRFKGVFESKMIGTLFWNAEGDITDANDSFLQMVGYTRNEVLFGEVRWRDMTPPEYREQDDRALQEIAATGAMTPIEKEYIRKDGSRVPILLGAASLPDSTLDGVAFALDITKRKLAEKALQQSYQEKKNLQTQLVQSAKLAGIGELSAGICHELNQPLMVIRGNAQLGRRSLGKGNYETDELLKYFEFIERNTKRMMNTINHLRIFSRQSKLIFSPVSVNNVIEDCFIMIGEQLHLHNIDVEKDLASDLPKIHGDASQLEQVLLNLIANARDAMDVGRQGKGEGPGGDSQKTDIIEIVTRVSDDIKDVIEILVKDNGNGIPPESVEKIFDPFFTTKEIGKGTGLGLSVSYGIIKEHRGKIEVTETGPEGTTFRIKLPIVNAV